MAFRMDKLTVKAQEAVQNAHTVAQESGHRQLTPLHLLRGLLMDSEGIPRALLSKLGANVRQIESQVTSELSRLPSSTGSNAEIGASRELLQVFDEAQK
ncbi:MAG: ATP-dependent chaperone ClpB, partial [Planctomycetaceae bacterium]|nr:ATP-dependent chaperone ClpB [Planctomycetaceae bacterium]